MNLSVDGGGSKLRLLLADADLNLISSVQCGGVNINFIAAEEVRSAINDAVELCIPQGTVISRVSATLLCPLDYLSDALARKARVEAIDYLSEGELGLLAGTGRPDGFVALSGTGSNAFVSFNGIQESIGGLGMLLGDEGSGYEIGRKGLKAVIHACDGRGGPTMLTALLQQRWGLAAENLPGRIYHKVSSSASPRIAIASFAPIVGEAACCGDEAAIGIYNQAGRDMALHINSLIARISAVCPDAAGLPITLCGGAWKGSHHMFSAFRQSVLARHPGSNIVWPQFDAVVGGLVHLALCGGMDSAAAIEKLSKSCSGLIYNKPGDWR